MARTVKKKKELTIEEKLAEALVPVEEQPYQVPENWCWTKQGNVSLFLNGRAYKQTELLDDNNATPILRVGNLFTNSSWYYSDLKLEDEKYIDNGDLIYAWSASFGPFIWDGGHVIYHYHIWKIILSDVLSKQYYYYWLLNDTERLSNQGHGTGMIHVTKAMMEKSFMPLPPLPEQQRIVDRIESLFAKLDEAKEKAQAVVDGFEDRKAAILHKAFTGELTKGWRVNNCVDYKKTWNDCALGEFASSQYGYTEKSSYERIGPKFLRITDIQDEQVIWKDVPYCKIDDTLKEKYSLKVGDIVVARIGATTGKSYMVIDQVDAVYASYLIRVTIQKKESLKSKYLYYFLQCPAYWQQITELSSGIAQPGVNGNKLKTLKLPIPDCKEQDEIVRLLDLLLPVEKHARDSAELVLDQIDTMKKSILARAFRGELGTNDPTDESAVELLKRIL